jgi:tetratricopeptide (TPR) repeat protein
MAYARKGDFDRATADLEAALRINPNHPNARGNLEEVRRERGQQTGQTQQPRAAPQQTAPSTAREFADRGISYAQSGDYDRAIADLSQAIRLNPKDDNAYNWRAYAYSQKRDYDRAIADYNQAIRLNPNYESAYYSRGLAYYMKKDYNRAIADYEAVLRINPNHANAKQGLEYARQARGR